MNKEKDFIVYGYTTPTDGYWYYEGKEEHYTGEDYRTEERYREYKDCGFNLLFLQGNDPYRGEEWETSQTKKNMDNAYAAGITKITVCDNRLLNLSATEDGIIGEEKGRYKAFRDEKHLCEYVAWCMKDYITHPAFYGVMLIDEPRWRQMSSVAQMTKAIRKVAPQAFIQCNLLPLYRYNAVLYEKEGDKVDPCAVPPLRESFIRYIKNYLDTSEADLLTYDSYPMREEKEVGKFILKYHIPGLQVAADELKTRGKQFHMVCQAVEYYTNGNLRFRRPSEQDMRWQINIALAFGIKGFAYYSYWAKQQNYLNGDHADGSSFITHDGKQTPLYVAMKKVHAQLHKLTYLLDCEYENSTCFGDAETSPEYVKFVYRRDLSDVKIKECNIKTLIVTQLVHKPTGDKVVCLFNAEDPENNPVTAKIKAEFNGKAEKAFSLKRPDGEKLNDEITIEAGDGLFVIVKK